MNNGLLGWPGSRKVLQQMCATNDLGARQFFTSSTTWAVPGGVTRIRASALGGGGAGGYGMPPGTGGAGGAGGGGGLFLRGWLNVTQGETLTIIVGAGGAGVSGLFSPAAASGVPGGISQIVQAGHVVIAASGGYGSSFWSVPAPDQTTYYFEGTPLVVVPGKGGGVGMQSGNYAGSGGGGGGLSAQNTVGSAASAAASSLGGAGSMGAMSPGVYSSAGVAPLLGLPESGSGGTSGISNVDVAGFPGAQGSGGSGGINVGITGYYMKGGNGGAGFVMVEY